MWPGAITVLAGICARHGRLLPGAPFYAASVGCALAAWLITALSRAVGLRGGNHHPAPKHGSGSGAEARWRPWSYSYLLRIMLGTTNADRLYLEVVRFVCQPKFKQREGINRSFVKVYDGYVGQTMSKCTSVSRFSHQCLHIISH